MNLKQALKYRTVNWYRTDISSQPIKNIVYAEAWCNANIGLKDVLWTSVNNGIFLFFKKEHEIQFRLTWL